MKRKLALFIGVSSACLFLGTAFQNCAEQMPLLEMGELSSLEAQKVQGSTEAAPTDAKQTLESMMSLLDLKSSEVTLSEVNSEINYRRNLLVPQSDLSLLNSPSIIAITSLAGVICKQAVNKDKKATKNIIFTEIDFAKGPKAYGKVGALNTYASLAERFWARKPTSVETQFFTEAVEEYFETLDASALDKAAESDKLAIFICTGMLASPDSYLL